MILHKIRMGEVFRPFLKRSLHGTMEKINDRREASGLPNELDSPFALFFYVLKVS